MVFVMFMVSKMRCPDCGNGELKDFGNMKECQLCHFSTYFGVPMRWNKFLPESDFNREF